MTSPLRTYLLNTCRELDIEPIHLCDPSSEADLLTALLKEAIDLRGQDNADRSLKLLDAALEAGLSSDWIQDNRARGLIELNRLDEAQTILIKLQDSADKAICEAAESMLIKINTDLAAPPPGNEHSETLPDKPQISPNSPEDRFITDESAELAEPAAPSVMADLSELLEQAIALRKDGDPQASLNLLEATAAEGISNPWLDDNRARALVDLNCRLEAHAIWKQLASSDDGSIAEMAQGMADLQHQRLRQQLQPAADDLAADYGLTLQHINGEDSSLEELEQQILHEAIASREADDLAFSLGLIELAIEQSFNSPWLLDNKARALLLLDRQQEAVSIWKQLAQKDDNVFLQEMAETMLEQLNANAPGSDDPQNRDDLLSNNGSNTELRSELSADLQALLEAAITLRKAGQPEASLTLLDDAIAKGHRNAWLDDNRARALINLGQDQAALTIWQSLAAHPDQGVADQAREILAQKESAKLEELHQTIKTLSSESNWTLIHLNQHPPTEAKDFEIQLLNEAIAMREKGDAALSLKLLDSAISADLNSPWLQDNRARALVHLERRSEALAVWQKLAESENSSIRTMAEERVAAQKTALLKNLQANIRELASQHDWTLQYVRQNFEVAPALEEAIRKDAIAARDSGNAGVSLVILEQAIESGLESPWLRDNQARALIHLDRKVEAVAIWRQLAQLEGKDMLQSIATEMLEKFGLDGERQNRIDEAERLIADNKHREAIALLTEALLVDAEFNGYRDPLTQAIAAMEGISADPGNPFSQELNDHHLNLKSFDAFLTAVEKRFSVEVKSITAAVSA